MSKRPDHNLKRWARAGALTDRVARYVAQRLMQHDGRGLRHLARCSSNVLDRYPLRMDTPVLVAEHRYRDDRGRDELRLALYLHRKAHHDWYEIRVTIHEDGRELGLTFTRMVTSRAEARPVWREQARRLRALGYRHSD